MPLCFFRISYFSFGIEIAKRASDTHCNHVNSLEWSIFWLFLSMHASTTVSKSILSLQVQHFFLNTIELRLLGSRPARDPSERQQEKKRATLNDFVKV